MCGRCSLLRPHPGPPLQGREKPTCYPACHCLQERWWICGRCSLLTMCYILWRKWRSISRTCPVGSLPCRGGPGWGLSGASRSVFLVILLQCLTQYDECAFQIMFLEHVGDAHLVDAGSGRGVESCGRGHHHRFALVVEVFQTPPAELFRIVHRQLGHRVESSHRYGRVHARYAVESVDETFATLTYSSYTSR